MKKLIAIFFCCLFLVPLKAAATVEEGAAIHYDVPILSQEGLYLDGVHTGVGCVPVCIEMITRYWEAEKGLEHLDAQHIIDIKSAEGKYRAGYGMAAGDAADMMNKIGYHYRFRSNSDKEELIASFTEYGPLGVMVKTRWEPQRQNHSVVMIGWNPETEEITLNDPFYGSAVTWTWEQFDGIWGLNYNADKGENAKIMRRIYYIIYPDKITQER